MIKILLSQVKQYRIASILSPIFVTLETIMEVLIPFVISIIIDEGITKSNINMVYKYGILMIFMSILSLLFGILAGKFAAYASSGFAANLRNTMYKNIQTFSFSNIDKFSTSGLITRMTTDVTNVQNAFQMSIRVAVRAPLMLIFSVIMCMFINVKLSIIFICAIIILVSCAVLIIKFAIKIFDVVFKKYDNLNASIQENISAIRVVKAFVREDYEKLKFQNATDELYSLFLKAEKIVAYNRPVMMFVIYGCIIALSWFGANFIIEGSLTTGELTSMFSYIMSIMMSILILSMVFVMIIMSKSSAKRIVEVINEKPDIVNSKNPIKNIIDGSIDFNNVKFHYIHTNNKFKDNLVFNSKEILIDIDLHIKSGETIGIIGGTGSGKSTLISLISRLYDVSEGSVFVGGKNVKEYDIEFLRNNVSVVLQKNVLFSGTIIDNLRWGNENATEEECIEVCKQVCADEFINQFPNRYNTYIEQGGTNLSGGQKQRICIARALLKKPKILILDDSTSAVDTTTDAKIRESFIKKIPGVTKIIIAQRISSIKEADRIIVIDDGKINAFDTHNNLIISNEIYKEIYDTQIKAGRDFDEFNLKGGDNNEKIR